MSWHRHPKFRNEHMMIGPHRILGVLQNEMNMLGRQDQPWSVHGWELTPMGWICLMVRSVEVDPMENA